MTPLAFRQTLARLRISQQEAAKSPGVSSTVAPRRPRQPCQIKTHVEIASKTPRTTKEQSQ